MAAPQILQDTANNVQYCVDPATGTRYDLINNAWQASPHPVPGTVPAIPTPPPPPVPAAPVVMAPAPAPVAAPVAQIAPAPMVAAPPMGIPAPAPLPAAPVIYPAQPAAPTSAPLAVPPAAPSLAALGVAGGLSQLMSAPAGGAAGFLFADMSAVNDQQFRTIPHNTLVEASITKVEIVPINGKPGSNMKLTLTVCWPEQYKGINVFDYIVVEGESAEKTKFKLKRLMRVTDLLAPDGSRFLGQGLNDFMGQVVRFAVSLEEYEAGKWSNKAISYEDAFQTPALTGPKVDLLRAAHAEALQAAQAAPTAPTAGPGAAPSAPGVPAPPSMPAPPNMGVPGAPAGYPAPPVMAAPGVPGAMPPSPFGGLPQPPAPPTVPQA